MNKIDEMRVLERAATPGPWHCGELRGAWELINSEHMMVGEVCKQEDMELIVAMRNALPALLDEKNRLTADLAIAQREAAQAQKERDAAVAELEKYKPHSEAISALPDCNTCGKHCSVRPGIGEWVRINCHMWTGQDGKQRGTEAEG